jgi:dihydroxyacetone kinase
MAGKDRPRRQPNQGALPTQVIGVSGHRLRCVGFVSGHGVSDAANLSIFNRPLPKSGKTALEFRLLA